MKLFFLPISKIKKLWDDPSRATLFASLTTEAGFCGEIMYDSSIFFINYDSTILKMFVYIQITISL